MSTIPALKTHQPRLCFIHLPKCAGGALHREFVRQYGILDTSHLSSRWSRRLAALKGVPLHAFRERILIERLTNPRHRYVSGHFAIGPELLARFESQWQFITVLRDPVERWFSNYFFNRYKKSSHFAIKAELRDYVLSSPGRASARTYLRLLGGWKAGANSAECIERAQHSLDRFSIVGVVEHMDKLRDNLQKTLGFSVAIRARNLNPVAPVDPRRDVSSDVVEEVARQCADDMVIYRHALKLALGP